MMKNVNYGWKSQVTFLLRNEMTEKEMEKHVAKRKKARTLYESGINLSE